jgi:hypothetical protein
MLGSPNIGHFLVTIQQGQNQFCVQYIETVPYKHLCTNKGSQNSPNKRFKIEVPPCISTNFSAWLQKSYISVAEKSHKHTLCTLETSGWRRSAREAESAAASAFVALAPQQRIIFARRFSPAASAARDDSAPAAGTNDVRLPTAASWTPTNSTSAPSRAKQ